MWKEVGRSVERSGKECGKEWGTYRWGSTDLDNGRSRAKTRRRAKYIYRRSAGANERDEEGVQKR